MVASAKNQKPYHTREPFNELVDKEIQRATAQGRNPQPIVSPNLERKFEFIWENSKSFARTIRERREELGLTQVQVAKALDIKASEFIGMVEAGHRSMELNKVPRLADVLKIDTEDLCRLALFENAPQFAMSLFGTKVNTFVPANAKEDTVEEVRMTQEQIDYNVRLYSLPSSLRYTVLSLIDQFTALVRKAQGRGNPT